MATIVKGTTFSSTVTAGGMHTLVESATISGIDRTSIDIDTISVATFSTTPPSNPGAREVWHTFESNALATYDLTNTRWTGAIPQVVRFSVPSGGDTVVSGDCLMASGSVSATFGEMSFIKATGASSKVVAIATATVAAGESGVAVVEGPARVKCTGSITAGQGVKMSSTAGTVESAGAVGTGQGWQVIGTALTNSGDFVWINLRR